MAAAGFLSHYRIWSLTICSTLYVLSASLKRSFLPLPRPAFLHLPTSSLRFDTTENNADKNVGTIHLSKMVTIFVHIM